MKLTSFASVLKSPWLGVGLLMGVVVGALLLKGYVAKATAGDRYTDVAQVPPRPVAIILGAGVYPDGSLSPMLSDRVSAAVQLYQQGRVSKLLMTGDNSTDDYDEVTAMKRYAVSLGVPAQDITLDHAGFSTYESCYRAKVIFGVSHGVVVTQQFHIARSVYTCRQLGIDAVGLGTADWGIYMNRTMTWYTFREVISTVKAVWQVHVTRPQPTFLGRFEGID